MRNLINRLMAEECSLDQAIKSLESDINSEFFEFISEPQQNLMIEQMETMQRYQRIVQARIKLLRGIL